VRASAPGVVATLFAILVALVLPAAWVAAASDLLVPGAGQVDDRVVVVAFDEQAAEATFQGPIPHRDGSNLLTLAGDVTRGGGTTVVMVGFDGFTLTGGPTERAAFGSSTSIRSRGIAPLLDVGLEDGPGDVPVAVRYRVDDLASDFAGVALPLVTDGPGVVRTVPEVATVPTLEPGAVVRPDGRVRRAGSLVLGLAMRSVAGSGTGAVSATGADIAGRTVPLENGELRVRWSTGLDGADDTAVIPAGRAMGAAGPIADVVPPGTWSGKIVLIGTIDPTQTPYYDTPIGPLPELFIQANALNTLLTGEFLRPVPAGWGVLAAVVAAIGVALLWRRRWWWGVACGAAVAAVWLSGTVLLAAQGWVLDPLRPPVASVVTALALGSVALVRQLAERRRLARLFSEYVPRDVARDLVESGRAQIAQAGERLLVTVLFCDLRGFTPIAARLTPADVRSLLDRYYETFSQIVFDHGGTVLQYTGDEIFAVFGAPLPRTDHADAALACARAMQAALPGHNSAQVDDHLPEIAFGIGLNSGLVVAAHVGSSIRRQYAVIGDPVNVGARLCSQARVQEIVWSQALHDQLSAPDGAQPDGDIALKGIAAPVTIYRASAVPAP
jgi:adenylate cyclase